MNLDLALILKALHIIGFVSWFAGMFYLVRLLIYHVEAQSKPAAEKSILTGQFTIMEGRLYKAIMIPAMVVTWACGIAMIVNNTALFDASVNGPWLHIKLTLVFLLTGYHHMIAAIMKKIQQETKTYSSSFLRMLNEVATIFLVAIVFLAVLRMNINYLYFGIGMVAFIALIVGAVKMSNK